MNDENLCPCFSGEVYGQCCKRFHSGKGAPNALLLMRSRYSAYALSVAPYIISTTHPKSSFFRRDFSIWERDILDFCQQTLFEGLKIIEFIDGPHEAYVTFRAQLKQKEADASFVEKSFFQKKNGRWLYHSQMKA